MWVTPPTAARALGVSTCTVRRWAKAGKIPWQRYGGARRTFRVVWCPEAAGLQPNPRPKVVAARGGAPAPRVRQLAAMEADGALSTYCRSVLLDDDGLLNEDVYERLLVDLGAPKLLRRAPSKT